jgi:DNA-binding CsgD family transcriptional regulator
VIVGFADRLLTDANAELHPDAWLRAALATVFQYVFARDGNEFRRHFRRIEATAERHNDGYALDFARALLQHDPQASLALRDSARLLNDQSGEALAATIMLQELENTDPVAAAAYYEEQYEFVAATGNELFNGWFTRSRARIAQDTGDLTTCLGIARDLTSSRSALVVFNGLLLLTQAGLLAMDVSALELAVAAGSPSPGATNLLSIEAGVADAHRRYITENVASEVDPVFGVEPIDTGATWLGAKEAIDAGRHHLARTVVDAMRHAGPFPRAVQAAIDGTLDGDEQRWHDALTLAVQTELRLIATDALEALAASAARADSSIEALRLIGAAQRLRDETGYRWRFAYEQLAFDHTISQARADLGDKADGALTAGYQLDWKAATEYAQRARGERRRPRHGWASLTPTELEVVALVSEGFTNPQVAARLLMGRATVKTHLEHIFTKLAVHSRAELAAEATRRTTR